MRSLRRLICRRPLIAWAFVFVISSLIFLAILVLLYYDKPVERQRPSWKPMGQKFYCDGCFERSYKFILNNENICLKNDTFILNLLMLIVSAPREFAVRDVIRRTWASVSKNNTSYIRYVFILGNTENATLNYLLKDEHVQYGDTAQQSFIDSYDNLTLKTLAAFDWTAKYCKEAHHILKIDSDVWPNLEFLQRRTSHIDLMADVAGSCSTNSKPIRNVASKWYMPYEKFSRPYYPPICFGPSYLTSAYVAAHIVEVSRNVPFFPLEDVYVGLCLQQLGYNVKPIPGMIASRDILSTCNMKRDTVLTCHPVPAWEMYYIWESTCVTGVKRTIPKRVMRPHRVMLVKHPLIHGVMPGKFNRGSLLSKWRL